ncbi:hypothetical protein J6590_047776 [Homalodisca vitripennis]|nr:hypothetical protein J6590_047776 [Homalodisca vitripennis]
MGEFFLGTIGSLPQIEHPRVAWEENPSGVEMDLIDVDSSLKERNVELIKKDHKFIICFGLVSSAIVMFPHSILTTGPVPQVIFYHFLHCQWMITSMAQSSIYYAICYQMNHFCDRYLSSLEEIASWPHNEVSEDLIEDHRIVQAKLMTCVRLMDDTFGSWLAFIYITNCVKFLLYCYYSMYGIRRGEMGLTLLQMIWFLFFVYRPAVLTDHINRKNKKIMPYLVKMALKPFPDSTLFQINYFIRQLKFNVASVSAAGLADINKEIVTKSLSLFATSFVAVIQLEPQVQNLVTYLRRMINSTSPSQ